MKPDIVVDVGNSRVKWGRCPDRAVTESAALPHNDPDAWQDQLGRWGLAGPLRWVVSGVHPRACDQLADFARGRGDAVFLLRFARQLPLKVHMVHPDRVGIDRLLNAVAVNARRAAGTPAVIVDAGSAVTVDCVDGDGAFVGGAIFPGLRLMAQALHDHTALLPRVEVKSPLPGFPGRSTTAAIETGVYWAVVGGVQALVRSLEAAGGPAPELYLAGGDAALLGPALGGRFKPWPLITLEGIRLAVEALP